LFCKFISDVGISLQMIVLLNPSIPIDKAHRVLPGTPVFSPGTGDAVNIFKIHGLFSISRKYSS